MAGGMEVQGRTNLLTRPQSLTAKGFIKYQWQTCNKMSPGFTFAFLILSHFVEKFLILSKWVFFFSWKEAKEEGKDGTWPLDNY